MITVEQGVAYMELIEFKGQLFKNVKVLDGGSLDLPRQGLCGRLCLIRERI